MALLGCLFLFLFLVVVILLLSPVILLNILRNLLGLKTKTQWNKTSSKSQQQQHHQQHQQKTASQQKHKSNKKKFDRNEGEYIDFEEVKD